MPPIPADTLARRFRRLSASERRRFLAALWATRGYDTTVTDDGVVRATAGDRTLRIDVAGLLSPPAPEADVVVGTRSTDRLRRRAAGAEYLAPADLRDLLCFGVDREAGIRLADEHLGVDLWVDREAVEDEGRSVLRRGAVIAALVLAAATLLAVSGVGVPLLDDGGDAEASFGTPEPAAEAAESETAASVGNADGGGPAGAIPYPPGLNASGVTNASTVVDTHLDRVEREPRNLSVTYVGPAEDPLLSGVVRHESSASIYTADRFLLSARSYETRDENATPTYTTDAWADAERVHRLTGGNATERRYGTRPLGKFSLADSYESFVADRLHELLTAEETAVSTSSTRADALVVVTGTGTPDDLAANATEYRATAFLTPRGRLVRMTVTYVHAPTGTEVRVDAMYSDFGDVSPPREPDWVTEPRWE